MSLLKRHRRNNVENFVAVYKKAIFVLFVILHIYVDIVSSVMKIMKVLSRVLENIVKFILIHIEPL